LIKKGLALDSSVLVKWFKRGEEFEKEALKLRRDVLSSAINVLVSEVAELEVCRALVKAGYASDKVDEAHAILKEMSELGFLKTFPVAVMREEAKDLIAKLNLYVADAISLATAIVNSSDLLTEDMHLLKLEVKEFMKDRGLKVIRLKELYR